MEITFAIGFVIIIIGCLTEYIDSTLGMGYGTALTPILLMMGFEPMQVVPAVLLAELFTGFAAGIMHAKVGNVDFRVKTLNPKKIVNSIKENGFFATIQKGMSQHLKIALLIGLFSALGAVTGSAVAINLPSFYLKLYIGVLVVTIGIYILVTYNKQFTFTWSKLTVLSIIASFNKGISGGGYGPVVTGGQILSGVDGKNAVAITSVSEALTCLVGASAYFISGAFIDWKLVPLLLVGGLISIPFSALSVKKINTGHFRIIIGFATLALGSFTLVKLFV
ncbi:MAG: sulfite exporter TauE/SafE family protein [Clostridia bacterium]|jgi:uncharacterized membrane protein YfcA